MINEDALDFRPELLGPHVTNAMEMAWEQHDAKMRQAHATTTTSPSIVSAATTTASMVSWATSVLRQRRRRRPGSFLVPSTTTNGDDDDDEDAHAFSLYDIPPVQKTTTATTSVFDRALMSSRQDDHHHEQHQQEEQQQKQSQPTEQPHTPFRRWGMQPPSVTTTKPTSSSTRKAAAATTTTTTSSQPSSPRYPNTITIDDIPQAVVARGIAARTNRTNGLLPFLQALTQKNKPISMWHHRPGTEATRVYLSSTDGGDTIQYFTTTTTVAAAWPLRSVHVGDIVAVHPARNHDASGQLGTASLRKSKSPYDTARTFSVVVSRTFQQQQQQDELEFQWLQATTKSDSKQFRYIDLEADTEEVYWLVFRGFLLLHRDALVGRFAKQRAAGMGSANAHVKHSVGPLHVDEYHEPATAGFLERQIVASFQRFDNTYLQGFVTTPHPQPPPSDYFLGYKSPGTAIWSRLRQAGLETTRVYALDPARVMIKVKCPPDRLYHVAEVLRLQLKVNNDHTAFAAFSEDLMGVVFSPHDFRSSIRQTIIDFIIGSRIRDSGAELGPSSDLGGLIQARVPLHWHDQLEAVFEPWFYFWRLEHWPPQRRRGKKDKTGLFSTAAARTEEDTSTIVTNNDDHEHERRRRQEYDHKEEEEPPNVVTRFFLGCMYQPLDAIEEYFGEKVAFYFTWLQHTASHLVFLSVPGLILFVCMLVKNDFLHPLRPLFSFVVMMWTFIVLLNWKKRANMMAYRWGTMNYKEQETTRPQFKGDYVQDEITGEWIVRYPKWKRWLKYSISFPLTMFFTAGTLVLILWVHANRDLQLAQYLNAKNNKDGEKFVYEDFALSAIGKRPVLDAKFTRQDFFKPQFWFIVVGMPSMLGLFLPLLNFVLMRLSVWLNDFENYRTESEYRTCLIIKVFSFRFVCYFATLYYYAFVSSIVSEEDHDLRTDMILNGVLRVGSGVLVYTTVAQWWQNALQTCFPLLIRRLRMNHRRQRLADELRAIELEEERLAHIARVEDIEPATLKKQRIRLVNKRLLLDQAQDDVWLELMNPQHDDFPEYIQAVVQFTFVSCFSVVLPITPVLVLINYLISMRLDAYKLCKTRRRPLTEKTGGLGVWEHVLHIVAVISVLTNCWLIGFTSPQFLDLLDGENGIGDLGLFAIVVGWEHIMLLIKYVMSTSMSPFPKSVRDAMKRQQYETDKQRNTLMLERRRLKSPTKAIAAPRV